MKNEFTKNKASSDSRMWKFFKLIYNGPKKTAVYEIKTDFIILIQELKKKRKTSILESLNFVLYSELFAQIKSGLKTRNTVTGILTIVGAALTAKLTFYKYKIPT